MCQEATATGCCKATYAAVHHPPDKCDLPLLHAGDTCDPACCKEEDGPRCDDDCVKVYASVECHQGTHVDPSHSQPINGHCEVHLEAAMVKYSQMLASAACLCRSVLSSRLVHCCQSETWGYQILPQLSNENRGSASSLRRRPQRRDSPGRSCCDNGDNTSLRTTSEPVTDKSCQEARYEYRGSTHPVAPPRAACCTKSKTAKTNDLPHPRVPLGRNRTKASEDSIEPAPLLTMCNNGSTGGCCSRTTTTSPSIVSGMPPCLAVSEQTHFPSKTGSNCEANCCSEKAVHLPRTELDMNPKHMSTFRQDGLALMRVHLSVQGMICTGCETKLRRTLESIDGVSNVAIMFINSRAEFDLDSTIANIDQVIEQVKKHSGFNVVRVHNDYQTVEVYLSKIQLQSLVPDKIAGLIEIRALDGTRASIVYDPDTIGIRDLIDNFPVGRLTLVPASATHDGLNSKGQLRDLAIKTVIAAVFTVPVAVLSFGQTRASGTKHGAIASLVLATVVQAIAVTEFYYQAFNSLMHEHIVELDMLIVISITAAYVYSIVAFGFFMAGRPLAISEFFATSTLLITLVLLGRVIATYARLKAVKAVSMRSLQESKALLVTENGQTIEIDARLLQFGDRFAVQPHSRIPTDGVVIQGCSEIDESMLTGESIPVLKQPNDELSAGTVNGVGFLTARLTRLPGKNTITDIAELVEQANSVKPKVQDMADQAAKWFIPVVVTAAVFAFIIWLTVELKVRHHASSVAVSNAIAYSIAVLAISCPCAVGLAVPIVLVVTGGIAARVGVIIKSVQATERSWQVTDIVFDKTGTLTLPDLDVTNEHILGGNRDNARSIAKALVSGNQHPVSVSLNRHLSSATLPHEQIQNISVIPGCGITGTFYGSTISAGNPTWLDLTEHPVVCALTAADKTVLCITHSSKLIAIYGLRATIRPEAPSLISTLHDRGLTVHLISGDSPSAVAACANALSIPVSNVRARFSPTEKQAYVLSLRTPDTESQSSSATSKRRILFAGDGTNDALALATADIGVQIGTASAVLESSASVALLGPLTGIVTLLDLSRAAYRRIVFNFVWSGVYNVAAVLLAAGAAVEWRIPARWAGLGELVSVLPVVVGGVSMLFGRW
ncbi:heavy metal translocatin [Myriangium duriaei CBS 260.36]|uniref:Heavy metal translocatin n=1 Tax=Myriangium duriaei CBS 260.36 TaxID=1168546 RepID=A0A9P4MGF8_9PEZI|nr:heavy metal translocatin [Myriangium duriaei CBS 260.36]